MKHRIVLATDSLDPSGMGEHMLALGGALKDEYDIVLAAPEGGKSADLLRRGALLGLAIKTIDLGNLGRFRHWLQNRAVDMVHIHAGIGWEGHGLVRAAKGAGAIVLRTEHLPYLLTDIVQQAEYRAMLKSVDCRIAVSQAVAQSHTGQGRGLMQIIPNGIVPLSPRRDRQSMRAELGLAGSDPLILTVARFTAQKGYDLLVQAAPSVLSAYPQAKFVLVGDGPELPDIQSRIKSDGLEDSILVLGTRNDVPDLLASADLFVLPSHFEGLPLALLEAMAAAVPIVATDNGGTVEALGPDYPFLAEAGSSKSLARAIESALADQWAAASAAEASKQRFAKHFSAERMAGQTSELYQSLLSEPLPRGAAA
jgi:glycosyltransferase involved in cell wall biosynthesis